MTTSPIDLNIDAKSLGKVAVLFGGHSAERPVSLMSGNGVLAALQSVGVDAHAFDPAERPLQALKDEVRMERARDRERMALHAEEQQAARDEQIELAAYREAWRKLPGSCKDPRQCEPPPRPWRGEVKEDLFDPRLR